MKLYFYGSELVSMPCYPEVDSLDGIPELKQQMIQFMDRQGLKGLSAPQIGHLIQMVVVKLEDGSLLELINPRIASMYGAEYAESERCISFPPSGNECRVNRIQVVHVLAGSATSIDDVYEYRFKGKDSRVVQHELDHLQGTFFFDRAEVREKTKALARYGEWKKEWKTKRRNIMAATARPLPKMAVPENAPLEAGELMCPACGEIMKPEPVMGPRSVETVKYTHKNEERGCNYEVTRKVYAMNVTMKGLRS